MKEFEDNSQTIKFEAVKEEPERVKPQQNRSRNDEFSAARSGRTYENSNKKESGNGALIAIICVLTVLLVGAIVTTILLIKGNNEDPYPQEDGVIIETAPEEEDVPEIQNKVISCDLILYPETIKVKDDGSYKIKADLLDSDGEVFESGRIVLNEDTDIRQDGQRLDLGGFIYYIEETNSGDKIIFKGEIEEEDYIAMAISFETPPEEEPVEEPETEFIEGEIVEDEIVEEVDGI